MNLIKKTFQILKDNDLTESYADYVIDNYNSMQVKINKLREILTNISKLRRKNQTKERMELIESFDKVLSYIENSFGEYEYDYIDLCHLLKTNKDLKLTAKIKNKQNKLSDLAG